MAQSTNGGDRGHSRRPRAIEPAWLDAGKWGEWYPDVLGREGKLTTNEPKPYWQPGWLKQHDRLIEAMAAVKNRAHLVISGDLHAIAIGRMLRSGSSI